MTDQELRLECLRLAVSNTRSSDADAVVNSATKFYDFLTLDCSQNASSQGTDQESSDGSFQIPQAVSFRVSGLEGQVLRVLLSQLLK